MMNSHADNFQNHNMTPATPAVTSTPSPLEVDAAATLEEKVTSLGTVASLRTVFRYVQEHITEELTLEGMTAVSGMSESTLSRRFRKHLKRSPIRWLWLYRTLLAAECINVAPELQLIDIATSCGFSSSAHFSRLFHKMIGAAPRDYRRIAQERGNLNRKTAQTRLIDNMDQLHAIALEKSIALATPKSES
ncbi:MAG: helix-turn-helix domain-containing protein [Oligoflexales bacterium]